jgi:hypothetical protein
MHGFMISVNGFFIHFMRDQSFRAFSIRRKLFQLQRHLIKAKKQWLNNSWSGFMVKMRLEIVFGEV